MGYVSKADVQARLVLRERDEPSALFGGELRLRELLRAEYRAAAEWAGEGAGSMDRWNAALFSAGVVDPESPRDARLPLFTRDEVMVWPNRPDLWAEVLRVAQAICDLSEVGADALSKSDQAPAAE